MMTDENRDQISNKDIKAPSIRSKVLVPLDIPERKEKIFSCFISFSNLDNRKEHVAISFEGKSQEKKITNVRIHSECLTGDVFRSLRCDCCKQLEESIEHFSRNGGIILYLRQEGRGIGLYNKLDAYKLQLDGKNTFEANQYLDFPEDSRDYGVAAEMLKSLGISKVCLFTNNPDKVFQLEKYGIEVFRTVPTKTHKNIFNENYLSAKKKHKSHILDIEVTEEL